MVLRKIPSWVKHLKYRTCSLKKPCSLFQVIIRWIKRTIKGDSNLRFYKCRFGNHYHLGHYSSKVKEYIKKMQKIPRLTLFDYN